MYREYVDMYFGKSLHVSTSNLKGQCVRGKPFKFFMISQPVKSYIINLLRKYANLLKRMAEHSRAQKAGRPRKHSNGWESANTRIYISKETLGLWRNLRKERNFLNDDSVAKYLLSLHRPAICCLPRESSSVVDKHTEYHCLSCERLVID